MARPRFSQSGLDRAALPGPARAADMSNRDPLLDQPPVYWLGECHLCGRTRAADRDDIFHFMRQQWPECCGHTMTFRIVHGEPPLAESADE